MTDQPHSYHRNPDPPIVASSGASGEVYFPTSVGIGQAIPTDGGGATWVVTLVSENVDGNEIVVVLNDTALEMIRRCDAERASGFQL